MFIVCADCARPYHTRDVLFGGASQEFRCEKCRGAEVSTTGSQMVLAPIRGVLPPRFVAPPPAVGSPFGRAWRLGRPLAVIGLAGSLMAAVGEREAVVARAPFTAPVFAAIGLPVNLRGLQIEDVRVRLGEVGDKKVLMVEGSIVNIRDRETSTPDLRISLRGADGQELYVWTAKAPRSRLAGAARAPFAARLAAPPEGVTDAMVKFVSARDRVPGIQEGS